MRNKRKMETVRIRKANATIKKEKVVCFAQDRKVNNNNFNLKINFINLSKF